MQVYPHRGARSFAPENSIPGHDAALAIGTHWVDMDVVLRSEIQSFDWRCLYEAHRLGLPGAAVTSAAVRHPILQGQGDRP